MSFADPIWLIALALVPLLILWQRRARQQTIRYAVRFTAVSTVRQAVETGSRWAARGAVVAVLAAMAAAAVALARPQIVHRIAMGQASLMLVLDHSGSMAANDVDPTRLRAAIRAANAFIDQLPSSARVGAIGFSNTADIVQQPITNHALVRRVIDGQVANGGTATGPALDLALRLLRGGERHHPPSAIVLLSDGAANIGVSPVIVAQQARHERIPIYTVALGTPGGTLNSGPFSAPQPVPPDPQLMREIATESGARAFDAQTSDQLSSIYQSLGKKLSTVERERDVTPEVALIAAAFLLVGIGAAARTAVGLP
jgi:Ca-activated chloride channel family protein